MSACVFLHDRRRTKNDPSSSDPIVRGRELLQRRRYNLPVRSTQVSYIPIWSGMNGMVLGAYLGRMANVHMETAKVLS